MSSSCCALVCEDVSVCRVCRGGHHSDHGDSGSLLNDVDCMARRLLRSHYWCWHVGHWFGHQGGWSGRDSHNHWLGTHWRSWTEERSTCYQERQKDHHLFQLCNSSLLKASALARQEAETKEKKNQGFKNTTFKLLLPNVQKHYLSSEHISVNKSHNKY